MRDKDLRELNGITEFIVNTIRFFGFLLNTSWFIITGIMIILKSIWDFDNIPIKILGILFGVILILSSVYIVAILYLFINALEIG